MSDQKKLKAALYAGLDPPVLSQGMRVIRGDGWYQVVTPDVKDVSVNEVMLSTVTDAELDRRIEGCFGIYQKYGVPFKWAIGPMSSPQVEARIASRASSSWDYSGMVIDSNAPMPGMRSGVTIERVNESNFSDYLKSNVTGWGLTHFADQTRLKLQKMLDHPQYRCFIARKGDQVMGSGATVLKDGYGFLIGAVVLETFRGQGAYGGLIRARLQDLHSLGYPFAVTQARGATSAPILSQLGFETIYAAKMYRFDP